MSWLGILNVVVFPPTAGVMTYLILINETGIESYAAWCVAVVTFWVLLHLAIAVDVLLHRGE